MAVLLCCSLISLLFCVIIRSWTALRSTKYSFGKRLNRRMISLRLKKPSRVRNSTFTLKLAFVLTVFLSNLKPACSSHHSDLSHNDNDRNLFSPSSLVVCEKLHQNQLTFYFQLLALSKIKPTRHQYFHIFLILLSGDVCLNPGPIKHPCSSCLKEQEQELWQEHTSHFCVMSVVYGLT